MLPARIHSFIYSSFLPSFIHSSFLPFFPVCLYSFLLFLPCFLLSFPLFILNLFIFVFLSVSCMYIMLCDHIQPLRPYFVLTLIPINHFLPLILASLIPIFMLCVWVDWVGVSVFVHTQYCAIDITRVCL